MSIAQVAGASIIVAGLEIPSRDPLFLATVGVHVVLGLTCPAAIGVPLIVHALRRHPLVRTPTAARSL